MSLLRTALGRTPQPQAPSRAQPADRSAPAVGFAEALGQARDGVEAADQVRAAANPSPSWHRDRAAPEVPATVAKDDRRANDASPAGSGEMRAAPRAAAGAGASLPAPAASALHGLASAVPDPDGGAPPAPIGQRGAEPHSENRAQHPDHTRPDGPRVDRPCTPGTAITAPGTPAQAVRPSGHRSIGKRADTASDPALAGANPTVVVGDYTSASLPPPAAPDRGTEARARTSDRTEPAPPRLGPAEAGVAGDPAPGEPAAPAAAGSDQGLAAAAAPLSFYEALAPAAPDATRADRPQSEHEIADRCSATAVADGSGAGLAAAEILRRTAPDDGNTRRTFLVRVATAPAANSTNTAPARVPAAAVAAPPQSPLPAEFGEQLLHHVIGSFGSPPREVVLRLHPAELGEVTIRVAVVGRDVSAWFATPQVPVQKAIIEALDRLHSSLGDVGYNLSGTWVGADMAGSQQPPDRLPAPARARPAVGVERPEPAPVLPPAAAGVSIYV